MHMHLNWKGFWNRGNGLWPKDDTASQNSKVRAVFRNELLCCHFRSPIDIHRSSFIVFLVEGLYPFIDWQAEFHQAQFTAKNKWNITSKNKMK